MNAIGSIPRSSIFPYYKSGETVGVEDVGNSLRLISTFREYHPKDDIFIIHIHTTERIGVWVEPIIELWRAVSDRYLAIYGLDCKVCGRHKYNRGTTICSKADRLRFDVCADCLRGYCGAYDGLSEAEAIAAMLRKYSKRGRRRKAA
jgi:hypothetical protein